MESVGRGDVKKADLMTYAAPALSQHFGRYMKALIASLVIPVICISVTPCAADPVQFPSRFSGGGISWSGSDPAVLVDIPSSQLDYRIPARPDFVYRDIFVVGVSASGMRSEPHFLGGRQSGATNGQTLRPFAMTLTPRDYSFYLNAVPVCATVQIREQPGGNSSFIRVIWESSCIPIDTSVPTSCTITQPVLLNHGVVTAGDPPGLASADLNINCNAAATGRLSLASANDRISLGGGYASIKTSTGPLNARLSLSKGNNTVVLRSELSGVGAGSWSGSGALSLNLD